MNPSRFVWLGVLGLAAGVAAAADWSVQNSRLLARYDEPARRLVLAERASGKAFATLEAFVPEGTAIRKARFEWLRLFKDDALIFTHPDGCRDIVMANLDPPFILLAKVLKNGDRASVTNRVSYPELALDLGVPLSSLNTLGTGGLLKPDKNPGSYMWTAVADPATRRGVVAGWITTQRGSGIVRLGVTNEAVRLLPHVDYGRLLLKPGQEQGLETFAIGCFDDARLGLEALSLIHI